MGASAAPALPSILRLAHDTTDKDVAVRSAISETCAAIGAKASAAAPYLAKWLTTDNAALQLGCLQALAQMGKSAQVAVNEVKAVRERNQKNPKLQGLADVILENVSR
jgi:hypothetical protein